jgi:chromatin segregation and condensation protein Rec8/ScpA/Scc1 (kleisin family)
LYLIRRQNLDILDIPIAEITRQYMKYIEVMAELQLELAGEYLLMAAMLAEIKSRMLLPRPPSVDGLDEDDPRAELVRRLQEYERFKKAAEDIDVLPRMERDTMSTSAELIERKVVRATPQVTLQEMLLAFKDVLSRAEMFAHHHVAKERLSVRQRMSDILSTLRETAFLEFVRLFRAEEGRMGVTVTFIAILELMKEGLIEIVQAEPYAPIHVRPAAGHRHLTVVSDSESELTDADAENVAALAQPAYPDENDVDDEEDVLQSLDTVSEDSLESSGEAAQIAGEPADEVVSLSAAAAPQTNESAAEPVVVRGVGATIVTAAAMDAAAEFAQLSEDRGDEATDAPAGTDASQTIIVVEVTGALDAADVPIGDSVTTTLDANNRAAIEAESIEVGDAAIEMQLAASANSLSNPSAAFDHAQELYEVADQATEGAPGDQSVSDDSVTVVQKD